MVNDSLQFISNMLDKYLMGKLNVSESKVVLSNPVTADGAVPDANRNKVVLSLVNMDRTAVKAPISFGYKAATANPVDDVKPGNYTLYVLVSMSFDNYTESLKFLDEVINYFSEHTELNRADHPELPAKAAKIEVAHESTDGIHMRSIWLAMGARYQPSLIYKLSITAA